MKKSMVLVSTVLSVSVALTAAVSAQSFGTAPAETQPRYECGYFYQDGLRVTDCYDRNGVFLPDLKNSDDSLSVGVPSASEGYAEDEAARISDPAMMGDFEDDYDRDDLYGDPRGLHFIRKIEYSSRIGNYEAEVTVPEIKGMADSDRQASLNDYIKSVAYDVIDQFENDARVILADFPDDNPHFGVFYDYYFPTDSESVLTLALDYLTLAGSSSHSTAFFNFNKQTRELILMDDYFIPGSAAANILRDEIQRQMHSQMTRDANVSYWIDGADYESDIDLNWDELLASVGNNNQYWIDENGDLIIVFNKYDVAPGYMGNPEFVIPTDVVAAMDATVRH